MTLRVGIIGCGFIAALHSRALQGVIGAGLADAAVVATHDVNRARAESFARGHGADVAASPEDLLDNVDVVWICTPTSSHRELVEAAAERRVATFCEKPLAPTLADAEALVAVADEAGIPAQVGLVLRTSPVFVALHSLLAAGAYGRPMAAVFRDDQYLPNQGQYGSEWRADVSVAGGGTLIEHSIHDLDLLRWLLGDVADVSGRTANFAGHDGIEDVAAATLRFTSGATASLVSIWHQVLTRPSTRRLEIHCEHAVLWTDDDSVGPLHVQSAAGLEVVDCPLPPWTSDLQVDEAWRKYAAFYAPANLAFLLAVAAGRPPDPDLSVGLAAHRIADAVYRSASSGGTPVPLTTG